MKKLFVSIIFSGWAALCFGQIPAITVQPQSQTVALGGTVTLSVTATGPGPLKYQWQFNGTNVPGSSNIIMTVAGSGTSGFFGDGGQATNANLSDPAGVALDKAGNLYIADQFNARIREVSTNGIITTVAGGGSGGLGDGGQATNASLNQPLGIAFDAAGNLFISDSHNNLIRRVQTNGIIATVAGGGTGGLGSGPATNASLNIPSGLVFDATGNLYFSDTANNRIRKVDTNGIITTFAGGGGGLGDGGQATNAALGQPYFIAFDAAGNLLIADQTDQRVRKVATNGIITTIAGNGNSTYSGDGGAATNASLSYPLGLAVDTIGNVYIGDDGNNRIRKVDLGGIITTVAGNGSGSFSGDGGVATNASLHNPSGVTLDTIGNLIFADLSNNRIREVSASSPILTISGVTAATVGNYTVIVSNPYGAVTSAVATVSLIVSTPPSIVTQPTNQMVYVGQSASFSVMASGTPPLSYQWDFNQTNIANATNSTLVLTNVQPSQSGNYAVQVSNVVHATLSSNAVLNVNPWPILGVTQSGGFVFVFWPVTNSGFMLESTPSLSPPTWLIISNSPVQIGNDYMQFIPMAGTNQFYRLQLSGQ